MTDNFPCSFNIHLQQLRPHGLTRSHYYYSLLQHNMKNQLHYIISKKQHHLFALFRPILTSKNLYLPFKNNFFVGFEAFPPNTGKPQLFPRVKYNVLQSKKQLRTNNSANLYDTFAVGKPIALGLPTVNVFCTNPYSFDASFAPPPPPPIPARYAYGPVYIICL